VDRQSGYPINRMRGLDHVVLNIAANTMLGTKQRRQVYFWVSEEQVGCVMEVMVNRRLITD
jgi:hypothetical protein